MSYKSVDFDHLQKVFVMAHRLACEPSIGDRERKFFKAIAYEIWLATGDSKPMPEVLPTEGALIAEAAIADATRVKRGSIDAEEKYFVMMWCCSSGNCVRCMDLPVGKRVRLSVMGDKPISRELAEKCFTGWRDYSPTIETADGQVVKK